MFNETEGLSRAEGAISHTFHATSVSYYRARYYDAQAGRFLSEDPGGLRDGINLYRFVKNDPPNAGDPFGLYTIDNQIALHRSMAWNLHCPPNAAGACTIDLFSDLDCSCHQMDCRLSWKADATLHIHGNMWVYNGPWNFLRLHPRDRTVHDTDSAIAHEYNVHINVASDSVRPLLQQLESKTFGSEEECRAACAAAKIAVPRTFSQTLRETQERENHQ